VSKVVYLDSYKGNLTEKLLTFHNVDDFCHYGLVAFALECDIGEVDP
jgi:hypothetical protein